MPEMEKKSEDEGGNEGRVRRSEDEGEKELGMRDRGGMRGCCEGEVTELGKRMKDCMNKISEKVRIQIVNVDQNKKKRIVTHTNDK